MLVTRRKRIAPQQVTWFIARLSGGQIQRTRSAIMWTPTNNRSKRPVWRYQLAKYSSKRQEPRHQRASFMKRQKERSAH
uniref:Uncharacterized protein n=1 Tax=Knipowitschia caucasica TaxID=637954 RepID=A0AAV2KAC2_KNICA